MSPKHQSSFGQHVRSANRRFKMLVRILFIGHRPFEVAANSDGVGRYPESQTDLQASTTATGAISPQSRPPNNTHETVADETVVIGGSTLAAHLPSSANNATLSSRHLSSGVSADTFAGRRTRLKPIVAGSIEKLEDPFVEMTPNEQPVVPASDPQASNPSTLGRWSDEYDKFPTKTRRLSQPAPESFEPLEAGYQLKPPPVLHQRIWSKFRPVAYDSSDEGENELETAASQENAPQSPPLPPQELRPMLPLHEAISNVQVAMDGLTQSLQTLFAEASVHLWNAGVYANRLAARDSEIQELFNVLQARDEEIRQLRSLSPPAVPPQPAQNRVDDEESSDMYGPGSDRVMDS